MGVRVGVRVRYFVMPHPNPARKTFVHKQAIGKTEKLTFHPLTLIGEMNSSPLETPILTRSNIDTTSGDEAYAEGEKSGGANMVGGKEGGGRITRKRPMSSRSFSESSWRL